MFTVEEVCKKVRERATIDGNPMKVTPQRRLIFKALEGNNQHPTAENIHNQVREVFPDISLATVYKTLRELVEMGEILEIKHEGELSRFDPRTDDHSHLVCEDCGRLEDVLKPSPTSLFRTQTDMASLSAAILWFFTVIAPTVRTKPKFYHSRGYAHVRYKLTAHFQGV